MPLKYKAPKITDFPEGSVFYIYEFDVPIVHEPSNKWYNWFHGYPKGFDVTDLKQGNNWKADSFEEWVNLVKDSMP